MNLIEHYAALRHLHLTMVGASVAWFALRAFASLAGARWPLALWARATSWVVDTALLAGGASLWIALQLHPLADAWLGTKLALLVVYVGLGTMALRRSRGVGARLGWTAAALGCYGYMAMVAITRQPLWPLRSLLG
ncbi:MAG: SirB2 family protein [Gammaproteobacteria bacterium]